MKTMESLLLANPFLLSGRRLLHIDAHTLMTVTSIRKGRYAPCFHRHRPCSCAYAIRPACAARAATRSRVRAHALACRTRPALPDALTWTKNRAPLQTTTRIVKYAQCSESLTRALVERLLARLHGANYICCCRSHLSRRCRYRRQARRLTIKIIFSLTYNL